ncbi:MAG: hypothetical protein ACTSPN_01150 [Promethearchaeota archaeon]
MDISNIKDKKIIETRRNGFDSYSGDMNCNTRHPIFKSLMKIEFEKAIRNYLQDNS